MKVTHLFDVEQPVEEQIEQLIMDNFMFTRDTSYSWDRYYSFDSAEIEVNKITKRNYISIKNKQVQTGKYRPLKYD